MYKDHHRPAGRKVRGVNIYHLCGKNIYLLCGKKTFITCVGKTSIYFVFFFVFLTRQSSWPRTMLLPHVTKFSLPVSSCVGWSQELCSSQEWWSWKRLEFQTTWAHSTSSPPLTPSQLSTASGLMNLYMLMVILMKMMVMIIDTLPSLNCFLPHEPFHERRSCSRGKLNKMQLFIYHLQMDSKEIFNNLRLPMGGFAYGIPVKAR